jgi:transposase
MGAAYSQDLRDRVMAARDRGLRTKQVADLFVVCPAWVRRVMQRRREHGETAPRPRGGATVVKIDLDRLRALVAQRPDATTRELHERLGVACSLSAVDMALRRAGLSFKKRRCTPRSRTGLTSRSAAPSGRRSSPARTPAG